MEFHVIAIFADHVTGGVERFGRKFVVWGVLIL